MFNLTNTVSRLFSISVLIVAIFSFTFLVSSQKAEAFSTSDMSISEIRELLTELLQRVANIENSSSGTTSYNFMSTNNSCDYAWSRTLYMGSEGSDVSELQRSLLSLGYFNEEVTGYYGSVTESAVKRFQVDNNVVSYGAPETTGYGMFGRMTREALYKVCDDEDLSYSDLGTLSASPTSGDESLRVYFKVKLTNEAEDIDDVKFAVDYGDGDEKKGVDDNDSWRHTYDKSGRFTARLYMYGTGNNNISDKIIDTLSIEVNEVDDFVIDGCYNNGDYDKEGTIVYSYVDSSGNTRTISDGYFQCDDGNWEAEGSVTIPTTSGCYNNGSYASEGTVVTSYVDSSGNTRTISDASFECKNGDWEIIDWDMEIPLPTTSGCYNNGSYASEGTVVTSYVDKFGGTRIISDASFECKDGVWTIKGSSTFKDFGIGAVEGASTTNLQKLLLEALLSLRNKLEE